jgi:HD-like signal output (HDOD) protein
MITEKAASSGHGETALDRLLHRIRLTEEFPSISKYVIELNKKLAANPESSNATDLANVIVNDHGLTSKLLKMVNSAYYGLAGGKVSTVTRAVVVLGYENVRLATLSLTLFEHFKGRANAKKLKEAVVSSFWSGMMARELASMDGRVDPEEAFVCAMMSQLGRLVLIHYLPKEYQAILTTMEEREVSEAKAVKAVCGTTYDEVGLAVAKQWNFPSQICDAMQPLTQTELKNKKTPPDKLRVITSFMKTMNEMVYDDYSLVDTKRLQGLIENFEPTISISTKKLKSLIKDSLENVNEHALALSLNVSQNEFLDRLVTLYDPKKQPEKRENNKRKEDLATEIVANGYQLKDENQLQNSVRIPETRNPSDILMEGVQELSQIMMTDYEVDTIAMMSLEIFYRALDFQRVLMFIKDKGSLQMLARFGYGDHCRRLISNIGFPINPSKDLFNLSLQVGKDLIVEDSNDAKLDHLIPSWYREHIDAPSFVFLPIAYQNVSIGALYGDRDSKGLPLSETEHRYVSMLRNQFVLSIKYLQKGHWSKSTAGTKATTA